jgi:hypothetical protein
LGWGGVGWDVLGREGGVLGEAACCNNTWRWGLHAAAGCVRVDLLLAA